MSNRAINVILLLALLTSGMLAWNIRKDPAYPNFEILPEMVHSIPYDSFSPADSFPDGKTLREPVPNTIPRGYLPISYEPGEQEARRAGEELTNPYAAEDAPAQRRGRRIYDSFCQPCHGPKGQADGLVISRGFPAPPSLTAPEAKGLPDGRVFHIITYGQGNMPSHASQIAREDRWKAVLYIRLLQTLDEKTAAQEQEAPAP